jgi:hypothetical protein
VFPSNFVELPPALFATDKIKSDESFGKKETQEFKDLPLAARIKHVLYQDEIKFEDQSQDPSQSPSSETNSELTCSEINSSERTIPYINSFYDEFDNPMNEEDFSTQIKFEESYQASRSETDSGLNCPERKSSDINSLNDEIENPNETSFNNSGFDSSDLDMLEIKCEIDYSTNQIDPHAITHVFGCPSQLSNSETTSTEATSSELTSSNINSCDDENPNPNVTLFTNQCSDFDSSESKYEMDYSTNQIDPHEITHVCVCPMCQKKFVSLCDTRQHLSKVTRDNKDCL